MAFYCACDCMGLQKLPVFQQELKSILLMDITATLVTFLFMQAKQLARSIPIQMVNSWLYKAHIRYII